MNPILCLDNTLHTLFPVFKNEGPFLTKNKRMDNWWECRRCGIPNDPTYASCVSCGDTGARSSPYRRRSPLLLGSRQTSSRQRPVDSVDSPRTPWQSAVPLFSSPSPQRYQLSSVLPLAELSEHRRTTSSFSRPVPAHQPSSALQKNAVTGAITDLLRHQVASSLSAAGAGARSLHSTTTTTTERPITSLVTSHNINARHVAQAADRAGDNATGMKSLLSNPSSSADDDVVDSSGLFDTLATLQGYYHSVSAVANDGLVRGSQRFPGDRKDGGVEQSRDGDSISLSPSSPLTVRSSPSRKQASASDEHRGAVQHLHEHQQAMFHLRAQLSDALMELQANREGAHRVEAAKDREIANLHREVHRWKDEVMGVQKQHHDLAQELRRMHERNSELLVQVERLRVEANRRVPDIVVDEFRLRVDTTLEARSAAMQSLSSALHLLSMSIGDGIAHNCMAQSLDAAALLHSKTVASLQLRVRELEEELLKSHSGVDAS